MVTNRLARDLKAALEQQLCNVTEAGLVAQPPEHGEQHYVRRVLEFIEWRAGALVKRRQAWHQNRR